MGGAYSICLETMSEAKTKHMSDILEAVKVADAIRHARSPGEIWRALKAFAEPLGFSHLSVLSPMEANAEKLKPHIVYADAPAAFFDAFDAAGYLPHHPLIQHALVSSEPFTTRQIQARDLTPEQAKALEFIGTQLNLTAGFVVPVRRNGTLLGIVSYGGNSCRLGPIERSILHLLAHTAMTHALEVKDVKDLPAADLSPRELQCLQWASRGKTDAEIGVILGISARTARFHIENAKRKLGAATRVQAVAEAMRRHAIAA
jgi:LuxR family quorum sensing-dependent transcriptional regulator